LASTAGKISICNRALQLLGAKRITDVTDSSVSARAVATCYDVLRRAELRKHWWRFAIKRATLPAISPIPDWGKANGFTLPTDCLKLFHTYPERLRTYSDFEVEGGVIYTNESAPLYIRYVADIEDTNLMDDTFREVLSAAMAVGMCEELTQSNTKKQMVLNDYSMALREARKANAFESIAAVSPDDDFVTVRR
jgi:hypothetical protein